MPSAAEVISKTKVRNDIEDPVKVNSEENKVAVSASTTKQKAEKLDYKKYLN